MKTLMPVILNTKGYNEYDKLCEEISELKNEPEITVYLDALKFGHIRHYISHVLRPFLVERAVKVYIKTFDEHIRERYTKEAAKYLKENHIRHETLTTIVTIKYEHPRKNLTSKTTG